MSEWERGFIAGYRAGLGAGYFSDDPDSTILAKTKYRREVAKTRKPKRKASAASKRYGRAFKRLAPKYKKKSGGWKKDGFKNCAAAARRAAKK